MSEENKTHYRKVFKSDHLGVADLEDFAETGTDLKFTIAYVNQERGAKVAGKKIDANIAYFQEKIKPLVLNATNSKTMRDLTGSCFIENWQNVTVQLYIDKGAQLMGQVVGGVRISPTKVNKEKPIVTPQNKKLWSGAKAAYVRDGDFSKVLERAIISDENQQAIMTELANV